MPEKGASAMKATSTTAAAAAADQVCNAVGGRSDSRGADRSDSRPVAAVMLIAMTRQLMVLALIGAL